MAHQENIHKRKFRLLLIEDDQIDIMNFERFLRKKELHVVFDVVADGLEALEYLQQKEQCGEPFPHLILLDLNMPRMTGHEFLKHLKEHPIFRNIPVIILTTSSDDRDVEKAFAYQVAGFFVKPLDPFLFQQILETLFTYWGMSCLPEKMLQPQ